jgi:hypothetical protein
MQIFDVKQATWPRKQTYWAATTWSSGIRNLVRSWRSGSGREEQVGSTSQMFHQNGPNKYLQVPRPLLFGIVSLILGSRGRHHVDQMEGQSCEEL